MGKKTSSVASIKLSRGRTSQIVFNAVEKVMGKANWHRYVRGKNIVLKVNATWDKLNPGCTTTPMVVEGVIRVLVKNLKNPQIIVADTDTPGLMHVRNSFRNLGIDKVARKYGIKTVNLTNTDFVDVDLRGKVLKDFKISKILAHADTIISIPVMKTHSLSTVSLSLKNQWGCIHDLRHNYHLYLSDAIADVNKFYKNKVRFAILDGLFGMEGKGPKNGSPVNVGFVFASSDLVALDALVSGAMGFGAPDVEHILNSEKRGIGTTNYKVVGARPPSLHFKNPHGFHLAFWVEITLRRFGPFYEWLFFKTPLLQPLRLAARVYNDFWYYTVGYKNRDKAFKTNFGRMWKSYI